jgi:hypothetical protein
VHRFSPQGGSLSPPSSLCLLMTELSLCIAPLLLCMTGRKELQPYESMLFGGLSGGMGPLANNPLDVVKTRLQRQRIVPGEAPKYTGTRSHPSSMCQIAAYLHTHNIHR